MKRLLSFLLSVMFIISFIGFTPANSTQVKTTGIEVAQEEPEPTPSPEPEGFSEDEASRIVAAEEEPEPSPSPTPEQ